MTKKSLKKSSPNAPNQNEKRITHAASRSANKMKNNVAAPSFSCYPSSKSRLRTILSATNLKPQLPRPELATGDVDPGAASTRGHEPVALDANATGKALRDLQTTNH